MRTLLGPEGGSDEEQSQSLQQERSWAWTRARAGCSVHCGGGGSTPRNEDGSLYMVVEASPWEVYFKTME